VAELLALGQPGRLLPAVVMVAHGRGQRMRETLALTFTQGACVAQTLGGLEAQGFDRGTQYQELGFGLPYQSHEDAPLPSTTAAEAPHDFFQLLVGCLALAPEDRGAAARLLRDRVDEFKSFFCALYSVVASVPR
jgi:hypothetical protein